MRAAKLSALLAGSILVPSLASAEFNYTFVEAGFVDAEADAGLFDLDGDGYRIGGSVSLNDQFFLHGALENQSFDFGIDGQLLELGGGYRHAVSSDLDFVATASLVQAEVEALGFTVDDDGLQIGGGVRGRLSESFQVEAMLEWVDLDESGSDTSISLRGRYYFNDQFAIGIETEADDVFDSLMLSFRAEF